MCGGRVDDEEEMCGSDSADDMEVDQVEDSSDEEPEPPTRKRGISRLRVRIRGVSPCLFPHPNVWRISSSFL
jgi:hypothetical protein